MLDNLFRGGVVRYSKRRSLLDKILVFAFYPGLIVLGSGCSQSYSISPAQTDKSPPEFRC